MARPKSDTTIKLNKKIIARFTALEYENICENAKNANLSLSAYIHALVTDGKVDTHYHLSPHITELKPVLSELGKIGSNLNQIARFYNSGGTPNEGLSAEIRRCIAELFTLRRELSSLGELNQ